MQKNLYALTLTLLFSVALPTLSAWAAESYRVSQGTHPLDEYAVGALTVALEALGEGDTVDVRSQQLTQARVMEEVRLGKLDVMWLASNQQSEEQMLPIRFPLLKGLLGYRICIINPNRQSKFLAVDSIDEVKGLSFGQGLGWPDVDILRSNDLNVVTTAKYENLFYMVEGGRFDGFPRGVLEPWVEIQNHSELGLTVDRKLLMIYGLPFYLFVDPSRPELAEKIHRGLDLALQNGAFEDYFYGHPLIRDALSKANLKDRIAFNLQNPTLPRVIPLDRKEYWFDINDQ